MKSRVRSITTTVTGPAARDTLLGTGLLGASELTAGCALGCLLIWLLLAVVIVLLWALVAFLGSLLPL